MLYSPKYRLVQMMDDSFRIEQLYQNGEWLNPGTGLYVFKANQEIEAIHNLRSRRRLEADWIASTTIKQVLDI